jgi:hypothetical protein
VKEREREGKSDNTIYKQAGLFHLYKEKLRGKEIRDMLDSEKGV